MKTFLLCAFVLSMGTAKATNYYFSNESGDDSRSAIMAQSPLTPWKTLNKLNSFFVNLQPGDSVLLKRGETFYGSILAGKSGTKQYPIVIGAYSRGANPVVTGLISLTWSAAGSNLWRCNETLQLSKINMVTVNGTPAGMGRWPNVDNGNGGYDTIRSSSFRSVTDARGLTNAPSPGKPTYFVGAEIVVRTKRWLLDRHPITSYNPGTSTITFDPSSTNEVPDNNKGYFIQDDSTVLDRQTEWWYNRDNGSVKMYWLGSPANVSAANLQTLFVASAKSYITIDNITFNGCNADAISLSGGTNIVVQNSTIKNVGRNAVKTSTPNCSFLNNTILDVMSKGVMISAQAHHTVVRYNRIRNVSQIRGLGTSQQEDGGSSFSGDGVYIRERAATVEYNTFNNMGYSAVHLTKVDSAIIRFNFIDTVCNVYDDGGAIYIYTGDLYTNYGRQISNNIILHGIGAFYGSGVNGGSAAGAGVAGIYNDKGTSAIEEYNNTVAYFEKGIFSNYGNNRLKIARNTFYNNTTGIQINTRLSDRTRSLKITSNIALAASKTQKASYIYSDDGDVLDQFGVIDSNYYSRPISDQVTMTWQSNQGSNNLHNVSLVDWRSKFPNYDANSKKGPVPITSTSQIKFEYNATNADKTIPLNGTYVDTKGNTYASSIVLKPFSSTILILTSTAVQLIPPTVSITTPLANASYVAPSSVSITAAAADADGTIAKVDFYNGTTLLGTKSTSPYTINWNGVTAGNYTITAKATDNNGQAVTSIPVSLSVVKSNVAPTVSLLTPTPNILFTAPASISVSAAAADPDGSVARVDFYNGDVLLGSQSASPYAVTWDNIAPGNYTVSAKATDNGGLVTSTPGVSVSVAKADIPATVSIISPSADAIFTPGASIVITANAADIDGSVTRVDFYNGSTLIGSATTSPYSVTWNNVGLGDYSLVAKATDNNGLITSTDPLIISVIKKLIPPTVSIVAPVSNATYTTSDPVVINATAADADGSVTKVDFYNGSTLLGSDNTAPYSFSWNNAAAGIYTLSVAATDDSGLVTSSDGVNIVVVKPYVAPLVVITDPSVDANFTSPASILITAAVDSGGSVTRVDFYNGSTLIGSDDTSPYSYTWNDVKAGNYALAVKAVTSSGLTFTSDPVSIIVTNPFAPTVSIAATTIDGSFAGASSISLSASAADAGGSVARVDFYNDTTFLGSDNSRPFSFLWTNVAPGTYSLTAKAFDNSGLSSLSDPIGVVVENPNIAPTISISNPTPNAVLTSAASIDISVAATDVDGSVSKVEFYNDSTLLGTATSNPYTLSWANVTPGTYRLKAVATDNRGAVGYSNIDTIFVKNANGAPAVSITSPLSVTFTAPALINIIASASDGDGLVQGVDFYSGDSLLGTVATAPYVFAWNNVPSGTYRLTAKATDDGGLFTTSGIDTVVVKNVNMAPTVSITSQPAATFKSAASITITATAADADGTVARVDFYSADSLLGTTAINPYVFTWYNVAPGTYRVSAKVTDDGGLIASSAIDTIIIKNANVPPVVAITSPSPDAVFTRPDSITIAASAIDSDGSVLKVQFFKDSTLIGVDSTSPYRLTINKPDSGKYVLTAKAFDNGGMVAWSSPVYISVLKPNLTPVVTITSPSADAVFSAPASINITADATDPDGSVVKVQLFKGSTLIGVDSTSPYTFVFNNAASGKYTFTAKVFDNGGKTALSQLVYISVSKSNVPPTLLITSPAPNAVFSAPASINVSANATDADGSIVKVQLFKGSTLIGVDSSSPYTFTLNNATAGRYTLTREGI